MEFITSLRFKIFKRKHHKSESYIWFRTNENGVASKAVWASACPSYGSRHQMSVEKIMTLHKWFTTNCYVRLGNQVWEHILGIPMGFSCSPLWCTLYLMSYEIKFIQRLAKLGRKHIMAKFNYAPVYWWFMLDQYRKCTTLSWSNTILDNSYWIYPLYILEIKTEMSLHDHP